MNINMKKILVLVLISFFCLQGYSQKTDEATFKKYTVVLDVFNDFWVKVPDSIYNRFFNQGVGFSGYYNSQIAKTNFSLAIGVGLTSHNFYSDGIFDTITKDNGLRPFNAVYPKKSYDKNKISLTFLDIPVELRYRAKNAIRASVGFKVGFLLDSHTKYRGYDYLYGTSEELKVKHHEVRNVEKVRYGITARFGWKFINLTGFYSMTGLFKKGHGDEMYPISVGISLMPF
jgi:hypothetical protein